jgi:hypothetical protein
LNPAKLDLEVEDEGDTNGGGGGGGAPLQAKEEADQFGQCNLKVEECTADAGSYPSPSPGNNDLFMNNGKYGSLSDTGKRPREASLLELDAPLRVVRVATASTATPPMQSEAGDAGSGLFIDDIIPALDGSEWGDEQLTNFLETGDPPPPQDINQSAMGGAAAFHASIPDQMGEAEDFAEATFDACKDACGNPEPPCEEPPEEHDVDAMVAAMAGLTCEEHRAAALAAGLTPKEYFARRAAAEVKGEEGPSA